ncbi:MAG TPA: hypothetical protein VE687_03460 [Stellaceae bacterium]|nr:hypothetical protein [Stellaceae bacterium]
MAYHDFKIHHVLAAITLSLGCAVGAHQAAAQASLPDGPIACDAFQRGPNGSWTVLQPATISPNGVSLNLVPGETFAENQFLGGIEVTNVLDRNCGNE